MGVSLSRVRSIAKAGSAGLTGVVTLTGGANVTLTQSGQDISIAAAGSGTISTGDSGHLPFYDGTGTALKATGEGLGAVGYLWNDTTRAITISSGVDGSGEGANVAINSGSGTPDGGNINLFAGNALGVAGVGGDIQLIAGPASGGGTAGKTTIQAGASTTDILRLLNSAAATRVTFSGSGSGSIKFTGSGSGSATVAVAAAAGTPNDLVLPIATGTSGQALITDGANPQQLSWSTISSGLADPGANGFVDRTSLNVTAARTLTGTSNQISITNGGGGGNPVFSTPQDIATASTPQFARLGLGQAADATASVAATQTIAANTAADGIILQNTGTASSGNQMYSPGLQLAGAGFKSNATTASHTTKSWLQVLPLQNSGAPWTMLDFSFSTNNATRSSAWKMVDGEQQQSQLASDGYLYSGKTTTPSASNFVLHAGGAAAILNAPTSTLTLSSANSAIVSMSSGVFALTPKITTYNAIATAGNGVPSIYASVATTGATATVGATNLQVGGAVAPAGLYRVSVYLVYTTTGAAAIDITLGWTDPGQAQTKQLVAALSGVAKNYHESSTQIRADGIANITYTITVTGRTTDVFAYYLTLERLQ